MTSLTGFNSVIAFNLNDESILNCNAINSTKDLIVVLNSDQDHLILYRLSSASLLWTSKLVKDKIVNLIWNETGLILVGITSKNLINLISINNGSVLSTLSLPISSASTFTSSLSFQAFTFVTNSLTSASINLINKLPPLPSLGSTAVVAAVVAPSGVFGSAKNAMLLRERAKTANRVLNLSVASFNFPSLALPSSSSNQQSIVDDIEDETGESVATGDSSMLIVGDSSGVAHLYFAGSIYIGSISILAEGSIISSTIISPTMTAPVSTRISFLTLSSPDRQLSLSTYAFELPKSIALIARQVTTMKAMLAHAFEAVQEVRTLWDEARRISTAWLARLEELGGPNGETQSPITQLFALLMTGRATPSLLDFLSSKMNQRAFTKLESSTIAAFTKLKTCTFMSLAPSMERSILLLDELKTWSDWPEQFDEFRLDATVLRQCIVLASQIISNSCELETFAVKEEVCFSTFCKWIQYELEKIAHVEGSEVRPCARFHILPVSHYIQHCLADSVITPYFAFGLAATPLEGNTAVREAEEWCVAEDVRARDQQDQDKLEDDAWMDIIERKMSEDSHASLSSDRTEHEKWHLLSIPVLLHVAASKLGTLFNRSMGSLIETRELESVIDIGNLGAKKDEDTEARIRSRLVKGDSDILYHAWCSDATQVYLSAVNTSTTLHRTISASTSSESRQTIQVIDFDFSTDSELVLLLKHVPLTNGVTSYSLSTCLISSLDFESSSPQVLCFDRTHTLSSQFPPTSLAVNDRAGRRIVVVLGGEEGRRMEVLDLDGEDVVVLDDLVMK